MKRLHLVTSRKPIAGAVQSGDTLVFMNSALDQNLINDVLMENSQITLYDLRVIKTAVDTPSTGPSPINYGELVRLVTSNNSVVSW